MNRRQDKTWSFLRGKIHYWMNRVTISVLPTFRAFARMKKGLLVAAHQLGIPNFGY
jgi:hypothetical protein